MKWKLLSRVQLSATPLTVACRAPQSMEFSRQEYWSGLPFPSLGDLPNLGIDPGLLHCRQILYRLSYQGSPRIGYCYLCNDWRKLYEVLRPSQDKILQWYDQHYSKNRNIYEYYLPEMWNTWIRSLGWEDPPGKGKATHSSILAWRSPWTV